MTIPPTLSAPHSDLLAAGVCAARAGVAGNPSDALGGAALAVPVHELCARVELRRSDRLRIRSERSELGWASVTELVQHAARFGHEGGARLVSAAIVTLVNELVRHGIELAPDPFEVVWSTDIPRSVGLAGSSALVIATMRALLQQWHATLAPEVMAALALEAESVELGVAAGWMDRATQAHELPTLVDTRRMHDARGHAIPEMRAVSPREPIELVVAWDPEGAAPSGRLHGGLRERAAAGEPLVHDAVEGLVAAAHAAADAVEHGDHAALRDAVRSTCSWREALGALDATTARLVALAEGEGAAASSAGSGGAVLVVPAPGTSDEVLACFAEHGRPASRVVVE